MGENPGAITTSSRHDYNLFLKGWFNGSIKFGFNSVSSNTWLFVCKTLERDGAGRPGRPIRVAEGMSTVPIPGAAWLLGAGWVGLAAIRKKRLER